MLVFCALQAVAQPTPPGTLIVNQASVEFIGSSGLERVATSNEVTTVTAHARTRAALDLVRRYSGSGSRSTRIAAAVCTSSGQVRELAPPMLLDGTTLGLGTEISLAPADRHHGGEPLIIRLVDPDRNLDSRSVDTIEVAVTGSAMADRETLRLGETAANSGEFVGYLPTRIEPAAQPGDCVVQSAVNSRIEVSYVDPDDASDTATASVLADPVSRVFDARSGALLDGVTITLIDAATGLPARVLDDDGVSVFPARIESGAQAGPGEYRYPLVPPGRYRLDIEPPPGYAAPSQQSDAQLQTLDGAPWFITEASRQAPFDVDGGMLRADIPVDPAAGHLFLDKRASSATAAVGDYVEFRIAVAHTGGLEAAQAVEVVDRLPAGLRYVDGSGALLPDGAALDPLISGDGAELVFRIGDIEPDAGATLRYVVAVVPGTRARELENTAFARSGASVSNTGRAVIRLTDELFTDTAFLAGRVMTGACSAVPGEAAGLAGARVYLEDGRFAVTDESGRYHFEGLEPGMHAVQLDLESLPEFVAVVECSDDPLHAGTAHSRFVELRPGALGRVDFHTRIEPPPAGSVELSMRQRVLGETFEYEVDVAGSDAVTIDGAELMIMLPDGVRYIDGSAAWEDGSAVELRESAQVLSLGLGQLAAAPRRIGFSALPDPALSGTALTRALVRFESAGERHQTPIAETSAILSPATVFSRDYVLRLNFATLSAELRAQDMAALDAVANDWRGVAALSLAAAGHSDYLPISAASRSVFADNYELSYARAHAVVTYLSESLRIDPARITVEGLGPDRPVADNRTPAGRAENRRVELLISGLAPDTARAVELLSGDSGAVTASVAGRPHTLPAPSRPALVQDTAGAAPGNDVPEFALNGSDSEPAVLWPPEHFSPAIPSIKVVLRHAPGARLELLLNDQPVSALNFEGREQSEDGTVALSRWRGINLADGGNTLTATITNPDGTQQRIERALHFAGPPVRAELLETQSYLVADGRTRPRLAVRFLDRWGQPARRDTVGSFAVEAPYRSWDEIEQLRENSVIAVADRRPAFKTGEAGIAYIELEPTSRSGEVRLQFEFSRDYPQELRAWLRPAAREWILVGLLEGTLAYNEITGSMENAGAAGIEDGYASEGRVAFFARGQVRGSVLTAAFDSRPKDDDVPLGGVIDPDRYYVLYGDNTEQRFDAATREKLYLRIERDAFAALFGDFETGMTVTELSRYSRTLTGFQAQRSGRRLGLTAFAADTNQAFVRDELRGEGTSGPYQLSHRFILSGSDKLRIEVRDRFRPERIVSDRPLARHVDYDIDYTAGTIYFREPVASRDFEFDPVFIVVDYETQHESATSPVLGGRAAVHLGQRDSELGISVVRDTTEGAEAELQGADFSHRFGAASELRAELARSAAHEPGGTQLDASAWLLEFEHQSERRQLKAWLRETGEGFGLGQQRAADSGTRRTGVQLRNEFSESWLLETEAYRQESLIDAASRTVIEGTGRYQGRRRVGHAGLRSVAETIAGEDSTTNLAVAGGSWKFFDSLVSTRANVEMPLAGDVSNIAYPARTLIGVDLEVGPNVTVFAEREDSQSQAFDASLTRIGTRTNPTEHSRVDSSISSEMTEFGPRNFANLGMNHAWNLGERWVVDAGYERSRLLSEPLRATADRLPAGPASLGTDFAAAFAGFGYRGPDWSVTTRAQWRSSETDRQRSFIGGFYREPESGRGFSAELNLLERSDALGSTGFDGRLRLGWARRPDASRWIVYNRADWIAAQHSSAGAGTTTVRFVNHLNAHYRPGHRHEFALHHALKYVRSDFDSFAASGIVNLIGADWRRRLSARFDFGLHASWYGAPAQDVSEHGLGFDVSFAVAHNMLMHVGYNIAGFEDEDFSRARFTARGPFLRFSMKLDQASLRDILRR